MNCDDIEEIVTTSHRHLSQSEDIDAKLKIWKPKVLSALTDKLNLNLLHMRISLQKPLQKPNHSHHSIHYALTIHPTKIHFMLSSIPKK